MFYGNEPDPYQMRNLAADPAQAGVLDELADRLHERLDEMAAR